MQQYLPLLQKTALFEGLSPAEIQAMLPCLSARVKTYTRGSYVFSAGDTVESVAILLAGQLHIRQDDYWGRRILVSIVQPGDMFGEAYALPGSGPIFQDAAVTEDSQVLFLDIERLLWPCTSGCDFHGRAMHNLYRAISQRNRHLLQRLFLVSRHSTREKVISYLSQEARRQQSSTLTLPLNRQQLADFLAVDRSALSAELSRMQKDGLITFRKNHFILH